MSPRSCQGSVWPPDIKGLGGFRGWGRLFYSWSHQAGFPLCGTPLEACQTFPYTAPSVHTHTHSLAVQLNTQRSPSGSSVSPPHVFQSHSHRLHISSRDEHTRPTRMTCKYIPVGTYHFPRHWADNICLSARSWRAWQAQVITNGRRCQKNWLQLPPKGVSHMRNASLSMSPEH